MRDGLLSVRSDLGDGPQSLLIPDLRVDVGDWVQAGLTRHDNEFTLSLEQGEGSREVRAQLGMGRDLVVHQATVSVGNLAQKKNGETDFQGCLKDVRFNGLPLPLDGRSRDMVSVLERRAVTSGCPSDACSSQPCAVPLRCVDLWRKHECRCPGAQLTLTDSLGQERCVPSPCRPLSCRYGAVCEPLSAESFLCRCPDGVRGHRCELGQVKGHRSATLSPSSILAISMCLLVFFAVLVAVTVWNQKGSRNKFRKRGVYHVPTEHESWEDIRENILNYNEEGGGEQDQNGYDISELKRPLCSSLSQSSSCTTAPLLKSSVGSEEEVRLNGPYFRLLPNNSSLYAHFSTELCDSDPRLRAHVDFRSYVSRIIWEADHDGAAFPPDGLHVWSVEGSGSRAGSLSSLESSGTRAVARKGQEEEEFEKLSQWGPKFKTLSDLYEKTQL